MNENIYHYYLNSNDLKFDYKAVFQLAGFTSVEAATCFLPVFEKVNEDIKRVLHIQAGFFIVNRPDIVIEKDTIICNNRIFQTGHLISEELKHSTSLAVFVCTIGNEFEAWFKNVFTNDPVEGMFADLLASAITESTANWTNDKIAEIMNQQGMVCSNRFSPGNCKWNVSEQRKLFSLLPANFCNISLTNSALMLPRKSLSGIVGIGKNVKKRLFDCAICELKDCFQRKNVTSGIH